MPNEILSHECSLAGVLKIVVTEMFSGLGKSASVCLSSVPCSAALLYESGQSQM